MPNKHFCQGPECHTKTTSDRFLKSKGIIRGRYAYAKFDQTETSWGYRFPKSDKYFCSQGCKNDWVNENMSAIEMGIPVPFIRERRFTKGYEKTTEQHYGRTFNTIKKIRVDNNVELE